MHVTMTAPLFVICLALVPTWVAFALDRSFQNPSPAFQNPSPAFRSARSVCRSIPNTVSLCHGVGYTEMRLPNLLGHDTMREVQHQSSSWVPLLSKQCHRDTKKFLCSLFTPVCLPDMSEPIWPCRSLCEDVRGGCLPVMSAFGYPWPEMLNCSQFPSDPDLCIPTTGSISAEEHGTHGNTSHIEGTVCDACSLENGGEKEISLNYCKSNFAVKFRISDSPTEGVDRKILVRNQVILKGREHAGELARGKSALWLPDGGRCACAELDGESSVSFVALGNLGGRRLLLSHLMKWTRTERELRKLTRSLQRLKC